MIDPFGRSISYLRVSVTDRCDLRCVYCMGEDMEFLPKADVLTLEEMERLCSAFVRLGVKKIRLTGGEPLVRRNVMRLIEGLSKHIEAGELGELTLTTNATRLAEFARPLKEAGVRRVNVSLDTLDPERFRAVTRWGDLSKVLAGIDAAAEAGLVLKMNMVALKGVNDDEFEKMVSWCGERGFDLTFIETMPMGDVSGHSTDRFLPLADVRRRLAESFTLTEIDYRSGGPARYVTVEETGKRVGFITPLSHGFCEFCNRVRLTCTGVLYMCLGQNDAADLRQALRSSESDEALSQAIAAAIARKPMGHDFVIGRSGSPVSGRRMSLTGG
jgi:cyclic pyranopterin phosphate synthase